MQTAARPSGMRGFLVVWLGQLLSMVGTNMTLFALTLWVWKATGQATPLALMAFFSFGPAVLLGPVAGALVDRWNRKLVMALSDLAAGLATLAVLALYLTGRLQVWHLYLAGAFAGAFESFQWPAYSASVTLMVDKEQYTRASGLTSFARSAANIFGPLLGGALVGLIDISGVIIIDAVTYVAAIAALAVISIPQPPRPAKTSEPRRSLWADSLFGFQYIFARAGLLGLQLVIFGENLVASFGFTVLAPMVLARSGDGARALGTVESALGLGGVFGGLLLSVWGGPRRRVHLILLGITLQSLSGTLLMGLGRGLAAWAGAAFLFHFFIPLINGSNQAIWQAKVPPEMQGRVFSARATLAQLTIPLGMLLAGLLADRVFEPWLATDGALAPALGAALGTGRGSGMALMFVLAGLAGAFIGLVGYSSRSIREVETDLADHDLLPAIPEVSTRVNGKPRGAQPIPRDFISTLEANQRSKSS